MALEALLGRHLSQPQRVRLRARDLGSSAVALRSFVATAQPGGTKAPWWKATPGGAAIVRICVVSCCGNRGVKPIVLGQSRDLDI